LIAAGAAILLAGTALAETPQGAAASLDAFLDRFPDLGPGYGVVVVTADEVVLNRTTGERRASTGAPLTPDTPIYIASQTKAFMGLLAARLDVEGVLDLDSHIVDYWPDSEFPEGVDVARWTLRDLVTHQVPIEVDLLTLIEAYITRVDPADYPEMIAQYGTAREPGFDYDNLGYNIYGAILETATGRSWQDWLQLDILEPLGLDHTSARTSDFPLDELSWRHIWQGEEAGWYEMPPKTDPIMQSAGGLVTSTTDMGVWLQTQLRGEGPEGSGLTREIFAEAQTGSVETHQENGRNAYELPCSSYALGWNVCDFGGHVLYIHGGSYTGTRTMMAFSPDLGIGIGVFSNSDNVTGWLTSRTVVQYLQYLTEHPDAGSWADRRSSLYPERAADYLEYRQHSLAEARAEESWGGWSWAPDAEELARFTGHYTTPRPYMDLMITIEDGQLHAAMSEYRLTLQPARPDLFAGQTDPFGDLEPFEFARDTSGAIAGFVWGEDRYTRSAE
tara:strand:- start:3711 stop:5219 length:1509 start_codon:yes stop_codon:yes gene_type:complete